MDRDRQMERERQKQRQREKDSEIERERQKDRERKTARDGVLSSCFPLKVELVNQIEYNVDHAVVYT